ncbi:MAG: glycerate kinase, partial [Opitutaceae bacterium]|nr:glycerate kinase [Opitutaceae bacterium]
AGAGLLQALGWQFLDASGKPLGVGGQILQKIARINPSNALPELRDASFHAACDVDNPFHGPRGAAFVFGPQKGATPAIVRQLDAGLKNFARVIRRQLGRDISKLPGAGAAGGLGGGLSAFLNARLTPGIELVLNTLRFDKLLRGADLVITGEGRMDAQTAMGKAPAGIAAAAKKHGVPVIAIAGAAEDFPALNKAGIDAIFPLPPRPMTLAEAMTPNAAAANIQRLATQICSLLKATSRPPKTQPPLHQKK